MALMLGKATQECGLKHRQTAFYRCTNVRQTTLWEVQKARVFPSPLMVIMNFVFSSPPLLTLPAEPFFYFSDLSEIGRGGGGGGGVGILNLGSEMR